VRPAAFQSAIRPVPVQLPTHPDALPFQDALRLEQSRDVRPDPPARPERPSGTSASDASDAVRQGPWWKAENLVLPAPADGAARRSDGLAECRPQRLRGRNKSAAAQSAASPRDEAQQQAPRKPAPLPFPGPRHRSWAPSPEPIQLRAKLRAQRQFRPLEEPLPVQSPEQSLPPWQAGLWPELPRPEPPSPAQEPLWLPALESHAAQSPVPQPDALLAARSPEQAGEQPLRVAAQSPGPPEACSQSPEPEGSRSGPVALAEASPRAAELSPGLSALPQPERSPARPTWLPVLPHWARAHAQPLPSDAADGSAPQPRPAAAPGSPSSRRPASKCGRGQKPAWLPPPASPPRRRAGS
jgi:hypothetical protein